MKQTAKSSSRTGVGVNQRKKIQTHNNTSIDMVDPKECNTKFVARIGIEQSPKTTRELISNTPNIFKGSKKDSLWDVSSPYYNKNKNLNGG